MNWKLHFIFGSVLFVANSLLMYFLPKMTSYRVGHDTIERYFPREVINVLQRVHYDLVTLYLPIIILILVAGLIIVYFFRLYPIPKSVFVLIGYYTAIFYVSGFLGGILWLTVTGTEL